MRLKGTVLGCGCWVSVPRMHGGLNGAFSVEVLGAGHEIALKDLSSPVALLVSSVHLYLTSI